MGCAKKKCGFWLAVTLILTEGLFRGDLLENTGFYDDPLQLLSQITCRFYQPLLWYLRCFKPFMSEYGTEFLPEQPSLVRTSREGINYLKSGLS